MKLQIIENESRFACENMAFDQQLLLNCQDGDPIVLHIYSWATPSITYGYFVNPEKFINMQALENQGIVSARRPTGGGIIFHLWDLAFGVVVPRGHPWFHKATLDNYEVINRIVKAAVAKLIGNQELDLLPTDPIAKTVSLGRFCMAKPTIYDVMLGSRKIAGAAQRKKTNGFLHQGTISLQLPCSSLLQQVILDSQVIEQISLNSHSLNISHEEMAHELKAQFLLHLN